jgi:3-hydroxybutyryl-CoA dehydrogenase
MVERIAIIGAGLMGHGLCLVFADAGYEVTVTDAFSDTLSTVKTRIAASLKSIGKDEAAIDRVSPIADFNTAVKDADIIIEAAPEKLALKQDLFRQLEDHAKADAILASNTSVIPIGQIAAHVKSKHRVLGTHWWNPPFLVPLVEVIQTDGTSQESISKMMNLLRKLGKVPVHVKKDVPGFVGNRLQQALWREAVSLVENDVCDAETIDLVIKNSFGRRLAVLGPMENADLVGTDLILDIHENVLPHLEHRPGPSPYLRKLVSDGKLGFKTNNGFRNWTEPQKQDLRAKLSAHLISMTKMLGG